MNMNRRQALAYSAGAAVFAVTGLQSLPAFATREDVGKKVMELTGGAVPEETGKVTIKAPEIAENSNTVPISISVDSAMSGDDLVQSVSLYATENPAPDVATFNFTEMSGAAAATTRMRLAKTQNVVAVAKMSDGSFHMARTEIKVTIGGCGG